MAEGKLVCVSLKFQIDFRLRSGITAITAVSSWHTQSYLPVVHAAIGFAGLRPTQDPHKPPNDEIGVGLHICCIHPAG